MTDKYPAADDTVSLATFKNALKDFFRFLIRVIQFFFTALRKNLGLFLLCCLAGLALAYLYTLVRPRYYETEMIIQQQSLSRKTYNEIIENLQELHRSKSNNDLGKELTISPDDAKKIISIKALSISNETLEKDTSTRLGQPFKIQVRIKDASIAPKLQKGLIHYLNNNAYVHEVREGRKKVFLKKLQFIDEEQQKLDSLKDTYTKTLASMRMPSTFYNNSIDPSELYKHSLDLENQRESIENWLVTDGNGILLIDSFKMPENPQSTSVLKILAVGLLSGIVLGILLSLILYLKKVLG